MEDILTRSASAKNLELLASNTYFVFVYPFNKITTNQLWKLWDIKITVFSIITSSSLFPISAFSTPAVSPSFSDLHFQRPHYTH